MKKSLQHENPELLHNAIHQVHQLIIREKNQDALLKSICEVLTQTQGFFNAWICLKKEFQKETQYFHSGLFDEGILSDLEKLLVRGDPPQCAQCLTPDKPLAITLSPEKECTQCPLSSHYKDRARISTCLCHEDLSYGWLCVSLTPDQAQDKNIQDLILNISEDIAFALNAIHNQEEKLKSQSQFRNLTELISDAVYISTEEGVLVDINERACQLTGFTREEILGKEIPFIDNGHSKKTFIDWWKVKPLETPQVFNAVHTRKDGSTFPVEINAKKFRLNNDVYIVGVARDISKRIEAENALWESELRFRQIYSHMGVGIAQVSLDFRIEKANQAYCQMLGYQEEELVGKHLKDITLVDDLEENITKQKDLKEGKIDAFRMEKQFRAKDGKVIYGILDATLIRDSKHKPRYFIGAVLDISDRKRVEQKIQENEKRYKSLFENAPLPSQSLDEEGRFLDVNPAWLRQLGYSREEVIGACYADFLHPDWKPHFEKNFPAFKKRGYVSDVRFKLRKKDGSFMDVSFEGCIGYHPDGQFKQTYCVFKDITESLKAEKQIQLSNKLYKLRSAIAKSFILKHDQNVYSEILKQILEMSQCPSGFFALIDKEGNIDVMTGCHYQEELKNGHEKPFNIFSHAEGSIFQKSIQEKRVIFQNTAIKTPWNQTELENAIVAPIIFDNESIGQIAISNSPEDFTEDDITIMDDICAFIAPLLRSYTQEESLKRALIEAKDKASSANKAKDDFLAIMSHEMRTPLNPIMGFTSMLLADSESPPKTEYLQSILGASERLLKLINALLDFSRLQKQMVEVKEAEFHLEKLLNEIIDNARRLPHSNTIHLVNGDIPPFEALPENLPLISDESILLQILNNLITNACKYSQNGSIIVRTGIREEQLNFARIRIEVEDNGMGIPLDKQAAIFDPFMQVDTSLTRPYEGAGLGLAICKKLVDILSGSIGVKSKEGEGSLFWIEIPVKKTRQQKQISIPPKNKSLKFDRPYQILVAEDQADNRIYIETVIAQLGGKAILASNGEEAIQAIDKSPFDLVLMDLQMPHMDGLEASRWIRTHSKSPNIPILALSAHQKEEIKIKAKASGIDGYLLKPILPQTLAREVNNRLSIVPSA